MEWTFSYLILIQCLSTQARHELILNRIIDIIQRRNLLNDGSVILGVPENPEDLPEAEPILPGHTLLRPTQGMLKSAVKFPQRDLVNAVYGSFDNLGITYGNTGYRTLYTGFRKTNNLLANLLKAINKRKSKPSLLIIEIDNENPRPLSEKLSESYLVNPDQEFEEGNDASEILDDEESLFDDSNQDPDYRRKRTESKSKFRDRTKLYSSSSSTSGSSESSDYEKNPGNPYTLHKNKYIQNWMWNHNLDGDHMNVNPFAPSLHEGGPSGAQIFFGRKWWYFNQDDYKPMG